MTQGKLFKEMPKEDKTVKHIGYRLYLKFKNNNENQVSLYHNDTLVKIADLSDRVAKRLFVIEAIELGAKKSHLAEALKISRQSIHNYIETKKHFGTEGLIHNYNPSNSTRQNRKEHANKILTGNKARQLEQI